MIFGNTYCAISRLEIKDGERCILLPLRYSVKINIENSKTDSNCVLYPFEFYTEAFEVEYSGNYAWLNGGCYEAHDLYMLVKKSFYENILSEMKAYKLNEFKNLQEFKTVTGVYGAATKEDFYFRASQKKKLSQGEISRDEFIENSDCEVSAWIANIFSVALFIDKMGIQPVPNICADQLRFGDVFERLREISK